MNPAQPSSRSARPLRLRMGTMAVAALGLNVAASIEPVPQPASRPTAEAAGPETNGTGNADDARADVDAPSAACAEGTLPFDGECVQLPSEFDGIAELAVSTQSHVLRTGRRVEYEHVPRRPDRPEDYDAYRYPVPPPPGVGGPSLHGGGSENGRGGRRSRMVSSGFDLDLPDAYQRRGPRFRAVGHGGVDLPQPRGTAVVLVALEGQRTDAVVVFTGQLFGTTVITQHTLLEGGESRDYLVLFGHLDSIAPDVLPGVALPEGRTVGFVGDSGSRGIVHLHLEVRRVRPEVRWTGLAAGRLLAGDVSVVVDPRNVLPVRRD